MIEKLNIDWSKQPLGQMSNVDMAKKLGCSATTVQRARERLGIPAFRKRMNRTMTAKDKCKKCGARIGFDMAREPFNRDGDCRDCWTGRYEATEVPWHTQSMLAECQMGK